MSDLERAADHQVLPVERVGDLLVVTPAGDLVGFSHNAFQSEFDRVKKLASRNEFRNVLVDLSRSAYFGSEMIGSLVELRRTVATSHGQTLSDENRSGGSVVDGGVTAICGLSEDMRAGLKIMQVDTLLLTFDDRMQAVRTLSHQSLGDRVGRLGIPWRGLVATALVVAVVCLVLFTPLGFWLFGGSATSDYARVIKNYERWQTRNAAALSNEERIGIERPMIADLNKLLNGLKGNNLSETRQTVVQAAKDLKTWMHDSDSNAAKLSFAASLNSAREAIREETGDSLVWPDSIDPPDETPESESSADSEGKEPSEVDAESESANANSPTSENPTPETPPSDASVGEKEPVENENRVETD